MKGKSTNMSTTVFNLRLFLEGLKRLRVIGLATAILSVTISALVPIVVWLESRNDIYLQRPDTQFLCVPVAFVAILAPFFFYVLFSFLQKRKESDFFHAIPYTRTCVYISFTAAALAFVWGIQIACGLTAGILWGCVPRLFFDLGGMVSYVLICMLAAAMLSGFMMLALTVSGTGGSCILLFALFTCFTRIVAAIFCFCMENIDLLPMTDYWSTSFFSPFWFLPLNIFSYLTETVVANLMYTPANILYSVVVTIALYVLAGLLYRIRRSEMAGNPSSGRATQALFRILFTLPLALLIPWLIATDEGSPSLYLVLVVCVVLVYFLYELITTKRPSNLAKIAPSLLIVVAACAAFLGAFSIYRSAVLNEEITVDEIKTVEISESTFETNSYQSILMENHQFDDATLKAIIAEQLAESQRLELEGGYYDHYWERTDVTLHLSNGRTICRRIILDEKMLEQVLCILRESEDIRDIMYRLPENSEIESGQITIETAVCKEYGWFDTAEAREIAAIFRQEFATLSEAQKDQVIMPNLNHLLVKEAGLILSFSGRINGTDYYSGTYEITDALPLTRAAMLEAWVKQTYIGYECNNFYESYDSAEELLNRFLEDLRDEEFVEVYQNVSLEMNVCHAYSLGRADGENKKNMNYYQAIPTDRLPALIELLAEKWVDTAGNAPLVVDEDTYIIHLDLRRDDSKYAYFYLECNGIFRLTAEDWEIINELLYEKD